MSSAHRDESGPLAPVLHELSRITGDVETERAARDRATIEALRHEVTELRTTVAQLRASHPVAGRPARSTAGPLVADDVPPPRSHAEV